MHGVFQHSYRQKSVKNLKTTFMLAKPFLVVESYILCHAMNIPKIKDLKIDALLNSGLQRKVDKLKPILNIA